MNEQDRFDRLKAKYKQIKHTRRTTMTHYYSDAEFDAMNDDQYWAAIEEQNAVHLADAIAKAEIDGDWGYVEHLNNHDDDKYTPYKDLHGRRLREAMEAERQTKRAQMSPDEQAAYDKEQARIAKLTSEERQAELDAMMDELTRDLPF